MVEEEKAVVEGAKSIQAGKRADAGRRPIAAPRGAHGGHAAGAGRWRRDAQQSDSGCLC